MYLFFASKYQKKKYLIEIFLYIFFSYVDMINVMTYDLYGSWTNKIGHHSALFHRRGEKGIERELNTVRFNQKKIIS
jgi:GH18 family chitinase